MSNSDSNPVWQRIKRGLPTPLRMLGSQLSDEAPAPGDESIRQVDDPFTAIAGGLGASALESGARMAAPEVGRLMADETGALTIPKAAPESLNMEELPRQMRAIDQGYDPTQTWYHGTKADIESFDPNALGASTNANSAKQGFFFSKDPSTASDYAELSNPRALLRSQAGQDVGDEAFNLATTDPKRALWKAQEDLSRAKRNTPESCQSYKQMLLDSQESIKGKLNGTIENKYAPKKYLEQKLLENQDKINGIKIPSQEEYESQLDAAQKAHSIAQQRLDLGNSLEANVVPAHLKMQNPYVHDFEGEDYRDTPYSEIMKKAKELGHDSVIFKNTYDPANPHNRQLTDIAAVFEPHQVRSKFAAFDPSKTGSGNISSGLGAIGLGAAGALGSNNAEASESGGSMPFNWDEHPIVQAETNPNPKPTGDKEAFNWDEHPIVQPSEGLLGRAQNAIKGYAKEAYDALPSPSQAGHQLVNNLPMLGGVAGGILGTPLDAFTGPMGNIVGASAGGALGTAAKNAINSYISPSEAPQTMQEAMIDPLKGGLEQGLGQAAGEGIGAVAGKVLPSVADYLGQKAASLKLAATGATGKQVAKFKPGTAETMFKEGIGGPLSDPKAIAEQAQGAIDRSGAEIGNTLSSLDQKGATVDRQRVMDVIKNRIGELSGNEGEQGLVKQLKSKVKDIQRQIDNNTIEEPVQYGADTSQYDKITEKYGKPGETQYIPTNPPKQVPSGTFANESKFKDFQSMGEELKQRAARQENATYANGESQGWDPFAPHPEVNLQEMNRTGTKINSEIPISKSEQIKSAFDRNAKWESATNAAGAAANRITANAYRQAAEEAALKIDPDLADKFMADKDIYSKLSPVQEASEKRAMQLQQSPHGGLLDMAALGAGGAIGHGLSPILGPVAAPAGAALGLAAKSLRPRYASMGAHSAQALSQLLKKAPEELGPYLGPLTQAASKGQDSLIMLDHFLHNTDPNYVKTIQNLESPGESK